MIEEPVDGTKERCLAMAREWAANGRATEAGRSMLGRTAARESRPGSFNLRQPSTIDKDSRNLRSRLRASDVDPILPTESYGTHRVLRQVIAQFQFGTFQEPRAL
jgi:hypothetical protein